MFSISDLTKSQHLFLLQTWNNYVLSLDEHSLEAQIYTYSIPSSIEKMVENFSLSALPMFVECMARMLHAFNVSIITKNNQLLKYVVPIKNTIPHQDELRLLCCVYSDDTFASKFSQLSNQECNEFERIARQYVRVKENNFAIRISHVDTRREYNIFLHNIADMKIKDFITLSYMDCSNSVNVLCKNETLVNPASDIRCAINIYDMGYDNIVITDIFAQKIRDIYLSATERMSKISYKYHRKELKLRALMTGEYTFFPRTLLGITHDFQQHVGRNARNKEWIVEYLSRKKIWHSGDKILTNTSCVVDSGKKLLLSLYKNIDRENNIIAHLDINNMFSRVLHGCIVNVNDKKYTKFSTNHSVAWKVDFLENVPYIRCIKYITMVTLLVPQMLLQKIDYIEKTIAAATNVLDNIGQSIAESEEAQTESMGNDLSSYTVNTNITILVTHKDLIIFTNNSDTKAHSTLLKSMSISKGDDDILLI